MAGASISIPSEKVQGVVQLFGVGGCDRTHRLPTRPTPLPPLLLQSVLCPLGGIRLLRHLCASQHTEPLSGAFTASSTRARGNHRQETWCCNTIVLSQVILAKNKLLLNNLQTHFHQMS